MLTLWPLAEDWNLMCLSLSRLVYHLWIDGSLKMSSPSFYRCVQFATSERQISRLGGFLISYVQSITSEPTDSQVSSFILPSCPVYHLWMLKLWIRKCLNWPCPIHHLWTDQCPDFIFQSLVDFPLLSEPAHHLWTTNTPNLVILNRSCPVHHIWTDEYPISLFFAVTSSL